MKLTKKQLKQIIKEELAQVLDESDQYARTGAEASLKPPFHTEEVNGVTIAPITNAGSRPYSNVKWEGHFETARAQLKQMLEAGGLSGYTRILIDPMPRSFGELMATTEDGKTVYTRLAEWNPDLAAIVDPRYARR
tara:strand:- start:219 stop:626 length:408 start_codon:yes stop_codon:yes gene_type:complete